MNKATSEIAKLTERISKDPKSKLFVPLAEEYKKTGDIEMAIHVLKEGLKNNPSYVTARSVLGKLLVEQGDLAGAQAEFEEVVKAIPDNLMAQRKLGDLYALQNRPVDAAAHYKTVLSLNPKDAETAMLVSEIASGRDIKNLIIPGPKVAAAAAAAPPAKQEQPQAAQVRPDQKPQSPSAPSAAHPAVPEKQLIALTDEEPEDVLVVEPLDAPVEATPASDSLESDLKAQNLDFLAESHQPIVEHAGVADDGQSAVSLNPFTANAESEPHAEPVALNEPVFLEPEKQVGPDTLLAETAIEDQELLQAEVISDFVDEPQTEKAEPGGKQADDFTTDTLAELYISQGFYEKAVDIYERMLVDKPNSQGLKDKLAHVRAMAVAAAPAKEAEEAAVDEVSVNAEVEVEQKPASGRPPVSEEAPQPRLDDWELSATKAARSPRQDKGAREQKPPHPIQFDVGFEPREYVPPDAVLKHVEKTEAGSGKQPVSQPEQDKPHPKKSAANRKETVDRLESWLKNIMKES